LLVLDRPVSAQNLEPQGLTAKIFWDKDLGSDSPLYFLVLIAKIFILKHLLDGDRAGCGQNIDSQGLTAKIFRNKDLTPQ
jgi:hypothetical protein